MAKQLDSVSDPKGEKSKEETNSPLKDKDQSSESSPFLRNEDNLKVQRALQKGPGELVEQQGGIEEKAAPAAPQQPLFEDQHRHLQGEEPAVEGVLGGAQE